MRRIKWGATVRAGFFLARGKLALCIGKSQRKKSRSVRAVFRIPGFARSWNLRGLSFTTAVCQWCQSARCVCAPGARFGWAHSHDKRPRAMLRVRFLPRAEFSSSRVSFTNLGGNSPPFTSSQAPISFSQPSTSSSNFSMIIMSTTSWTQSSTNP